MRKARTPVGGFFHARFRQMQARGADICSQNGIAGDQQTRQANQLVRQGMALSSIVRAHHHHAAAWQGARGPYPVARAVVGHQNQRHIAIEVLLTGC